MTVTEIRCYMARHLKYALGRTGGGGRVKRVIIYCELILHVQTV